VSIYLSCDGNVDEKNVGCALAEALYGTTDRDMRAAMTRNIICAGGGGAIQGFPGRLRDVRLR
jgi:hypothetical protein